MHTSLASMSRRFKACKRATQQTSSSARMFGLISFRGQMRARSHTEYAARTSNPSSCSEPDGMDMATGAAFLSAGSQADAMQPMPDNSKNAQRARVLAFKIVVKSLTSKSLKTRKSWQMHLRCTQKVRTAKPWCSIWLNSHSAP